MYYKNTILIFLLLFFKPFLFALSFHPKVIYGLTFLLYFAVDIWHRKSLAWDRWFLLSAIVVFPSALVGIWNNWLPLDILADISRFLAPFLGFSTGLAIFSRADTQQMLGVFKLILMSEILIFLISLISKSYSVAQGSSVLEYAGHGLEVEALFLPACFFLVQKKEISILAKLFLISYIIGYIIHPFLVMSKAKVLILLFTMILIFLFSNRVVKIFISLGFLTSVLCIFVFLDYGSLFSRFYDTYDLLTTDNYFADASTAFRLAEIVNIAGTLKANLPWSLFSGLGSGALYYDSFSEILGGVHQENFRADNGIHDVFFGPFAYIFRFGLLGYFYVLIFLVFCWSALNYRRVSGDVKVVLVTAKIFILVSMFSDFFVAVHLFGRIEFGLFLGLAISLNRCVASDRKLKLAG